MSAYPIVLEGTAIRALVVGAGGVGTRKARALIDAGARVQIVALRVSAELEGLASTHPNLHITRGAFAPGHLDGVTLVFAATDDSAVNAEVARLAIDRGIPVNVADASERGTFVSPAVHRSGDLVVAVSAGRVPVAATRIRDLIASTIDQRYAEAVRGLGGLRRQLLDAGDRTRWHSASESLLGADFIDHVEAGTFGARLDEWR